LKTFIAAALFTLILPLWPQRPTRCDTPIVFIVNSANPATSVSKLDLIDYYKKRRRVWPDGSAVRFIERNIGSAERRTFISGILKQSENDVDLFWLQQKLLTGDSAPIQVSSDDLVIEMVRSFQGAIGYISSDLKPIGTGVKTIEINAK